MNSYFDLSNATLNYITDSSFEKVSKTIITELGKDWKKKTHNLSGKDLGNGKFKIHRKFSGIHLNLFLGAIDYLKIMIIKKSDSEKTELMIESVYGINTKIHFLLSMFFVLVGFVTFFYILYNDFELSNLYFLFIPCFGLLIGLILMFWREEERTKLVKNHR